ncbi:GTP-binding protein [Streptomyces sp. NBC_00237]|uniref:CobW family GTP-binding protein n=1 Tax=Streptomyces sp. NBC_00237 TaxID=2975687 RepID=UPI00225412BE|nr:GTP-binding protein [Streptomyces sp. NBC_00237]MCX5205246.1 GTP-binding protein [Streptomyces sp. NBC_00237]
MEPSPEGIPGPPPLAVVLVGGLHSDARRRVVDRLLRAVPSSVALHHDLSEAARAQTSGAVLRTVRDATGELSRGDTPLVNDCACCALRADLLPELRRIAALGLTRLAIVELWDSVEPRAMAEVVSVHGGDTLTLTGVVTAVDPALVLPYLGNGDDLAEAGLAVAPSDRRAVGDTWARQLEYASVLALVDEGHADAEDRALLAQLHPTVRHVGADSAELVRSAFAGFDVEAAATAQHPACARLPQDAEESGVGTLVWHRHRPFHPGRLFDALEELCCGAVRSRGRFWLADRPDTLLAWDCAGGALCVEASGPWLAALPDAAWDLESPMRRAAAALDWHPEHGDCCQHLVFTSPGLDREGLERLLDSCLLTDAEYAEGRRGWERLPAAFDVFLAPAS